MLVKVGLLLLVAALLGFLILRGMPLHTWVDQGLAWIRTVGPVVFFAAMAILPAFGFPLSVFSLTAGPVFGPQLGLPLVSALVVLSIVLNLTLTYWLSRYAFRPAVERIVLWMGYAMPKVSAEDHLSLTLMVRVTPGPPFFVQSYLLGFAGVRFSTYMWVSSLTAGAYALAVVFFGDSLATGRGKMAVIAISGLIVLSVAISWVRRRYQKKKPVPVS
ncbi:MAG TPA: VTT domain-containing protein [Opitutaceae bacterium]